MAATNGEQADADSPESERHGRAAKIDDPEDYIRSRRLQEIYDAKEAVRDKRGQLEQIKADPDVNIPETNLLYALRAVVEDFLIAIEPLAVREAGDIGEPYWQQVELGAVTLYPPRGWQCAARHYELNGLQSILDAPKQFTYRFTTRQQQRHGGMRSQSERVSKPIPESVLMRAVRQGANFLADIGVEVGVETERTEYRFHSEMQDDDRFPGREHLEEKIKEEGLDEHYDLD
jgi:hypothetical protein